MGHERVTLKHSGSRTSQLSRLRLFGISAPMLSVEVRFLRPPLRELLAFW